MRDGGVRLQAVAIRANLRPFAMAHAVSSRARSLVTSAALACGIGLLAAPNCGGTGGGKPPAGDAGKTDEVAPPVVPPRATFDIVAFGRVLGTIAPCGCTTEPLGGLQYAFGWLEGQGPDAATLVLEPGSFLYPDPKGAYAPPDAAGWEQAESRASLLTQQFGQLGDHLVSSVGPFDVVAPSGTKALQDHALPRVVANLQVAAGLPALASHRVVALESNGVTWKVGVTAVIDPRVAGLEPLGKATAVEPALTAAIARMREQGAAYVIVMAHGPRDFAEGLARGELGIDLVVVGSVEGVERQRTGTPATKLGKTWVFEPGEMLQSVAHLRLSVDASGAAVPDVSSWAVVPSKADRERELARVEARLKKFEADPTADPAFLARLRDERDALSAGLDAPPGDAAAVTLSQVKVTCKLPVDAEAKQRLVAYDKGVAQANIQRFTGVKPPAPAKGKAGFAGIERCEECHAEAVEFWRTTVHAKAWQTLVEVDKQYDLSCVSCHVTGYRKPGGSDLIENAGLRDVQCEVCHGPGSLHVDDGGEKLQHITLATTAQLCAGECHTAEHSDTFDYVPYLRDVLGKGHGEAARAKLGDGPTGAELRKAGLEQAGGACPKM